LLVRRVAVLSEDALDDDSELGADVFPDGPVDGDVGSDGFDELAGDALKGFVAEDGDRAVVGLEGVVEGELVVVQTEIFAAVSALLTDRRFSFEEAQRVNTALDLYRQGKGNLSDYLLGLKGESAGARTTYTFDRGLRGESRFTVI